MIITTCAGVLEKGNAEKTIKMKVGEEIGYHIHEVRKVFESYMSPSSVTKIPLFFIAHYEDDMKVSEVGQKMGLKILKLSR